MEKYLFIESSSQPPSAYILENRASELYHVKSLMDKYSIDFHKIFVKQNKYENLSRRKRVISRAYFKLESIFIQFQINFNHINNLVYAALCEGPGGFVEYVSCLRKEHKNDVYYGITLHDKKHLKWKFRDERFIAKYGNLLYTENVQNYISIFSTKKAHLVTSDGGFGIVHNKLNYQEQLHIPLFFSEIVCAVSIQAEGGVFILKMYDIFTKASVDLLNILNDFYETVVIYKPNTSRPANSEKYIICQNFKNNPSFINKLQNTLFDFIENQRDGQYITSILNKNTSLSSLDQSVIHKYTNTQIEEIKKALNA